MRRSYAKHGHATLFVYKSIQMADNEKLIMRDR